ncbi:LuxR C-terminal-related transcriptional regulator [Actinophytocola sp.]|uniref:LuxR C-terminal-related transcriptional regulator n=1 Tax=Actinophytocola sp. TaxID=1872138 RepID=UPI0038997F6E
MSAARPGLPTNPIALLSRREREVLRLVAQDRTDRWIARKLGISERTVRGHVSRIILKLRVASRVDAAVAFAAWTAVEEMRQPGGSDGSEPPLGNAPSVTSG